MLSLTLQERKRKIEYRNEKKTPPPRNWIESSDGASFTRSHTNARLLSFLFLLFLSDKERLAPVPKVSVLIYMVHPKKIV